MRLLASLSCLLAVASTCQAANATSLQLLHVLYRHGARTPIDLYANDSNAAHWWQGLGQLTNEGKNNQLELGKFLRRRYGDFLSPLYHMNYTRVESSDVDRTLMSAQANLAGLYPPTGRDKWNADLPWQPIPVHTRPQEEDFKLRFINACQRYRAARSELAASEAVRKVNAEYAALFRYLSQHSGMNVTSVEHVSWLYDTLWIEDHHGLPIPEWARLRMPEYNKTVYPELLRPLNDLAFRLMGGTPELRRLGGGAVLADMAVHMQQKVAGALQPAGRQLFMYSGHDFNVATLLAALGVYDGVAPPLASCVILELHRDSAGNFFVQTFYRNETGRAPYLLTLPNCTAQCPWEAFRDITKPVRPGSVARECSMAPPPPPPARPTTAVIAEAVAVGVILLAFVVAMVAFCRSRRRASEFQYSALSTS